MKYVSTRNNQIELSFKDVFIKGLSEDGGLFVPKTLEAYKEKDLNEFKDQWFLFFFQRIFIHLLIKT